MPTYPRVTRTTLTRVGWPTLVVRQGDLGLMLLRGELSRTEVEICGNSLFDTVRELTLAICNEFGIDADRWSSQGEAGDSTER